MADFFGDDVVLVPVPRSSPLVAGALWPADVICREMVRQGLARSVEPALRRVNAVPKSAFSRVGERPNVDKHLETMQAQARLLAGDRITVVDDVVTKGRTLYAGCVLVQEAAPTANVLAFGLIRTMGLIPEVEQIVDPCTGTLTYNSWGDVDREP
jgi:predicted amidophosphoribosyltransferase